MKFTRRYPVKYGFIKLVGYNYYRDSIRITYKVRIVEEYDTKYIVKYLKKVAGDEDYDFFNNELDSHTLVDKSLVENVITKEVSWFKMLMIIIGELFI